MAGTYLHPGVYIEEVSGGARPIEAVGTSTAAFIGITERGPTDEARFITNFTEFQQIYGGYVRDGDIGTSYLAYAVNQFFQNGGRSCYVVRVEDQATYAELRLFTAKGDKTMSIKAISPGSWGSGLKVAIGPATTSKTDFNLYVFLMDELVELYEDVSMVDTSPFYVDKATNRSLYIRTKSEDLPDNPTLTASKDLTAGIDLSKVNSIKLQIDKFGPYVIDCSESVADKTKVSPDSIVSNINKAFANDIKAQVAFNDGGKIKIVSPSATNASQIIFTPPASKDATYDIFGLQESSWEVNGKDKKTIALALGLAAPDVTVDRTITLSISGVDKAILILKDSDLFSIVSLINTGAGTDIAYTDGLYLVLCSTKDITLKRTNAAARTDVAKLFGAAFYSYVHNGSGDSPATISSDAAISGAVTGKQLRLKIDAYPSFIVAFNGEDSAEKVADAINRAFQKTSKGTKKIAQTTSDHKVVLNSIATGSSGRLIIMSPSEGDATDTVLGTTYKNDGDFLISAEPQYVAWIEGNANFTGGATIGLALKNRTLSIAANSDPVEFNTSCAETKTLKELFEVFKIQTALNHKLLAKVTSTSTTVHVIVANPEEMPEIRFSIPLVAAGAEEHITDAGADTHKAYLKLFGNIAPFAGKAYNNPNYLHTFGAPDNNPRQTVIVKGEELDFSESLTLSGGNENRKSGDTLKNLTVGAIGENGVRRLDRLTDVNILVIPGWEKMSDDVATTFVNEGTVYCNNVRPAQARPLRDLFFVTHTPASVTKSEDAKKYVQDNVTKSAGGYTAIYYPWVTVNDPIGTRSPTISVPPSGMIAGLYASIDGRRGVWKAPAGTEAGLAGVVSLADQVSDVKQDLLNPFGVNAIRRMPGAGIVSWGARTLATNPEWKYIPVRRMAIMMEVSIYEGIQWAVFEPNDAPLWSLLRLNINAFMMNLYRNGAFQGATPDDAFFVKCDGETTTQIDIDLGKVNILVGFAPLKPAEFVIVRISQKAGKKD